MAAQSAYGKTYVYGTVGAPVTAHTARLMDAKLPSVKGSSIEIKAHDLTNSFIEKVAGLNSGDDVTLTFTYDETFYLAVMALIKAKTQQGHKITVIGAGNCLWAGRFLSCDESGGPDELQTMDITISIDTDPTYAGS